MRYIWQFVFCDFVFFFKFVFPKPNGGVILQDDNQLLCSIFSSLLPNAELQVILTNLCPTLQSSTKTKSLYPPLPSPPLPSPPLLSTLLPFPSLPLPSFPLSLFPEGEAHGQSFFTILSPKFQNLLLWAESCAPKIHMLSLLKRNYS